MAQVADRSRMALLKTLAEDVLELENGATAEEVAALKRQAVDALKAAFGNPNIGEARKAAIASNQRISASFRAKVLPTIKKAQNRGFSSFNEIAKYLNDRGVQTPRGGKWHPQTVKRIIENQ